MEVNPESPEGRILEACLESAEADGIVVKPDLRHYLTCFFMIGYNAGATVAIATNLDSQVIEEQVTGIIHGLNEIMFRNMLEE